MHQKWLTKLLGYDYEIMFREGKENKAAHALSRVGMEQGSEITALSVVQTDWLQALQQAWETDHRELKVIIDQLTTDPNSHEGYSWSHGILSYKGRLVVSSDPNLRALILQELHSSPIGGHDLGTHRTYNRAKRSFFWVGMKKDVYTFVAECEVC